SRLWAWPARCPSSLVIASLSCSPACSSWVPGRWISRWASASLSSCKPTSPWWRTSPI
ncbi:hypothetical protein HaLaN_30213, partial [Haematococcus lacustris]